jgi:3-isopropylmalate/(R)-2-methylmalate dehydratase large subunit
MPQTLFDKIWESHLVARRGDGRELVYIDRQVLHELHAPYAFEQLEKQQRPVRRPDLTFSMQDHTVATKPGRDDATNPSGAAFLKAMREGSRRNRIRLFDIDDPEQGISHVVWRPSSEWCCRARPMRYPTATPARSAGSARSPSAAAPASSRTSWRPR